MSRGTIDQPEKIGSLHRKSGGRLFKLLSLHANDTTDSAIFSTDAITTDNAHEPCFPAIAAPIVKRVSMQDCRNSRSRLPKKIKRSPMDLSNFNFDNILRANAVNQSNLQFHFEDNIYPENATGAKLSSIMENPVVDSNARINPKQLKPLQTNQDSIQFLIANPDRIIQEKTPKKKKFRTKTTKSIIKNINHEVHKELDELEKAIDQVFSNDEIHISSVIQSDQSGKTSTTPRTKITLVRAPEVIDNLPDSGTGLKIDLDESYLETQEEPIPTEPEPETEADEQTKNHIIQDIAVEACKIDRSRRPEIDIVPIEFSNFVRKDLPEQETKNDSVPQPTVVIASEKTKMTNIVLLRSSDDLRPQMKRPDFMRKAASQKRGWTLDVDAAVRCLMGDLGEFNNTTIDRMAAAWKNGYESYFKRPLDEFQCPYIWVDENTMNLSNSDISKTYISVFGVGLSGRKRLLSFTEKVSDSAEFWRNLLKDLERRDLSNPKLFIADCGSSLWQYLPAVFPRAEIQYCWNSVMVKIKQKMSPESYKVARQYLDNIRRAENIESALDRIEVFKTAFGNKYPVAVTEILKYRQGLFSFIRYPAGHRNSIESVGFIKKHFPPENLMAAVLKSTIFRPLAVYMVFNFIIRFEKNWKRMNSRNLLRKVMRGKRFDTVKTASVKTKSDKTGDRFLKHAIVKMSNFFRSLGMLFKNTHIYSGILAIMKPRRVQNDAVIAISNSGKNVPGIKGLTNKLINKWQNNNSALLDNKRKIVPPHQQPAQKLRSSKRGDSRRVSRPLSGLERELINDLNLEKKAFSS